MKSTKNEIKADFQKRLNLCNTVTYVVKEAYDSTADYWKVLANGNLMWDGKRDLYDENGQLLKRTDDQTFYGSFASAMGITKAEAKTILESEQYNISFKDNKVISLSGEPQDRTNDETFQFETTDQFKATYNFQMNYADQVSTKFGGSMNAAVAAFKSDLSQTLDLSRAAGAIDSVAMAGYSMLSGFEGFAQQYDATLYGERYGSFGTRGLLNSRAASAFNERRVTAALSDIAENQARSDNHPMYQKILNETISPLLGPDGKPSPMVGANRLSDDPIYFTTRTKYEDGKEHGWSRDSKFAMSVDLGTRNVPLEATTFTNATVFAQSSPFGWRNDSGGFAQMNVGPLDLRYVHLDNSWQLQRLMNLNQTATLNNLYRYSLPPGLSLGPLYYGELPSSRGTHLHMEFIWR